MAHFGLEFINTDKFLDVLPPHLVQLIETGRGVDDFNLATSDRCKESGCKESNYYLYTGRGPSGDSFHIGHLPSYQLTLALQRHIGHKIFFMLSDDEKVFNQSVSSVDVARVNVRSTLAQLKSIGFNEDNTIFHVNSGGLAGEHYKIVMQLLQLVSVNDLNKLFGPKNNIGEYFYPLVQLFPCFLYPNRQCVVVAGQDQDPFFRLARDLARRLKRPLPIIIYTRTLPGLDGSPKMSTSVPSSVPIFLTDTPEEVALKIRKIQQVGAGSLDELFQTGADLSRDVPYQISLFFQEDRKITSLVNRAYTVGFDLSILSDRDDMDCLAEYVDSSIFSVRDCRAMLTSKGIRTYLTFLINRTIIELLHKHA